MFFLHLIIVILSALGLRRLINKANESDSYFLKAYLPKTMIALGVLAMIGSFVAFGVGISGLEGKDAVKPCWYCGTKYEIGPGCSVCDGWGYQKTTIKTAGDFTAGDLFACVLYFSYGICLCAFSGMVDPPRESTENELLFETEGTTDSSVTYSSEGNTQFPANRMRESVASDRDSNTLSDGQWLCPKCYILNSPNHGQCKKCGTYRSSN